jgi:hypothetical protein
MAVGSVVIDLAVSGCVVARLGVLFIIILFGRVQRQKIGSGNQKDIHICGQPAV